MSDYPVAHHLDERMLYPQRNIDLLEATEPTTESSSGVRPEQGNPEPGVTTRDRR